MSIYAIKDEDGELRDLDGDKEGSTWAFNADTNHSVTKQIQQHDFPGGHVVELVEKAEPVEGSEEVGELLAGLRSEITVGSTTHSANYYVTKLKCQHDMSIEDIFRALDIGWTVKQPQRWYVKAPKEWDGRGERQRFYKRDNDSIGAIVESAADNSTDEQFTAEEIDNYHLGGFETVEVTDHD